MRPKRRPIEGRLPAASAHTTMATSTSAPSPWAGSRIRRRSPPVTGNPSTGPQTGCHRAGVVTCANLARQTEAARATSSYESGSHGWAGQPNMPSPCGTAIGKICQGTW
jgi:hypothetical protein